MKTMKTMKMLMVAMAMAMSGMARAAGGSSGEAVDVPVNPINVARAFALKTPAYYQCYFWGNMLIGEKFQWMQMSFMMRGSDFAITNLIVDGDNIPLPEPIYGLPMGDAGLARDAFLSVGAFTKSGEYAGYGWLQREVVSKGDSLVVALYPAGIRQEIPVDVAKYGNDIQITIEDFPYGYGYEVENGKLYVDLPPVGGKYRYVVRTSGGLVIGSGWLEPFKEVVTPNDAYVGVSYVGNVVGVEFPQPNGYDGWVNIPSINFDCSIPTVEGSNVLGKVVFVDVGSGGLDILVDGQCWISVQKVTNENGDMVEIPTEDHSISDPEGWHWTRVYTTTINVGKVVITIIPKPGNKITRPWGYLHRFYGSPNDPVG